MNKEGCAACVSRAEDPRSVYIDSGAASVSSAEGPRSVNIDGRAADARKCFMHLHV